MAQKQRPAESTELLDLEYLNDAAECLRTLAHPHRLRMVQLLLQGRYKVGELAEACGIPSHMASEHLRLMQRCGLLRSGATVAARTTRSLSRIWRESWPASNRVIARQQTQGIIVMRRLDRLDLLARPSADTLLVVGLLLGWFVLQAFVLPGLGVST